MATTRLHELLRVLALSCRDKREIEGISDDSRAVKKNWLFVSHHDSYMHQLLHIKEALQKGAVVLCEYELEHPDVYCVKGLDDKLFSLLQLYYGELCDTLCVCGVTGTNGKTSVAGIVTQLLRMEGQRVLRIGTHEVDEDGEIYPTQNTTPDIFVLSRLFQRARQKGIRHVVMEVSSHAIDQQRIALLRFDALIYTNITSDHMDYHLTQTHYHYTKLKLRRYLKPQGRIIFHTDAPGMKELASMASSCAVSVGSEGAHFLLQQQTHHLHGSSMRLQGYRFDVPLLGRWSCCNVAEAVAYCRLLHISYESLQKDVSRLHQEKGRMELFSLHDRQVLIDYAHTESALREVLSYVRSICMGRVICIIGCGGDRDKQKRPLMAQTALAFADIAVFTADNPRGERVCDILKDMLAGCRKRGEVFENRRYAIKHCLNIARKDDIIVIAGKGDEHTQEIRGTFYAFHDKSCVCELLQEEE